MLGAENDSFGLSQQEDKLTQPLACSTFIPLPPPAPPGEWERELGKKSKICGLRRR